MRKVFDGVNIPAISALAASIDHAVAADGAREAVELGLAIHIILVETATRIIW
jgi:hypothetical protein